MTTSKSYKLLWVARTSSRLKLIVAALSLGVALLLFAWSLIHYEPAHNFYGPRAIYSLVLLSIILALLGRFLLLRILKIETAEVQTSPNAQQLREEWKPLFLFDITAPIYLAAAVLISVPAAVLTAVITQSFLQVYTFLRGYASWREASYRLAATAVIVFLSGTLYEWIAGSIHQGFSSNLPLYHFAEFKELLGSILAAVVMLCLLGLVSFSLMAETYSSNLLSACRAYLHAPILPFQALVLSVGPLLPIVDIFDDATAELAWIFFLIPLFAIYYLALVS
ncbi:MAG TPA: hypothetical protein DCK85_02130, partial [Ktedonobacter sp.]|nr:hypothetical protein [Ktedonobacter sp.]